MRFYSWIRLFLSDKNKGRLSKMLIIFGLKPKINRKVISSFKTGIVVFSADFEMAWAFRFSKTKKEKAENMGLSERKNIPVLISMFEKHNIPITWATVGHLFLDECKSNRKQLPHPEMPRPKFFENRNWSYTHGDWYDSDPCTNVNSDSAWYASDLVNQILSSKVGHEIGCHSFSHIDFSYKNCTKKLAESELDACLKLAALKGIKLKSMVFPGGTFGNYESLKEKGFLCYRNPMRYHIDLPYVDSHGLVAIPSSLGLDKDAYGWTKEFHLKIIKKYLEKTIKSRLICHFWFHPSVDKWYLENIMPDILQMVADYRNSGKLKILTMVQLAEEVKNH